MLLLYIALVYTVSASYTLYMCFDNSLCFYGIAVASALLALLVEQVARFLLVTATTDVLNLEVYHGQTLIVDERFHQRFLMNYETEIQRYQIKVLPAKQTEKILKNGKLVRFMSFNTPEDSVT